MKEEKPFGEKGVVTILVPASLEYPSQCESKEAFLNIRPPRIGLATSYQQHE